jgi:hypothetical protein
MMMNSFSVSGSRGRADIVARPVPVAAFTFDACDHPAILLGGDTASALELRSMLQSMGFDVLQGAELMDAGEGPVVIVTEEFLSQPQNRQRVDRVRASWPLAPVFTVSDPADAISQLFPIFS